MATRHFNMDLARAVAVLLVTAFHVGTDFGRLAPGGFVGVDLFFVVSGYAMAMTWERSGGPAEFYCRRLARIYPAYICAVLIWAALEGSGGADIWAHLLMVHTLSRETFFSVSGVFWTLAVEAHFYLAFPVLIRLTRARRLLVVIFAMAYVVVITSWIEPNGRAEHIDEVAFLWSPISFLPLFIFGVELREGYWRRAALPMGLVAIGLLIMPGVIAPFGGWSQYAMLDRMMIGTGLAALIFVHVPKIVTPNVATRALSLIGVSSYSIYLYNFSHQHVDLGSFAAEMTFVLAVGVLFWWAIEVPAGRATALLLSRRQKSPTAEAAAGPQGN